MDVYNTSLITDVQYLAPLMAYFSPKQHQDSKVLTLDDGKTFSLWKFFLFVAFVEDALGAAVTLVTG